MPPPSRPKTPSPDLARPEGQRRRTPSRAAPETPGAAPERSLRPPPRTDRVEIRDLLGSFSEQTGANFS